MSNFDFDKYKNSYDKVTVSDERKEEIKSEHVPASCHDPAVLRDVRDRLRAL